MGHRCPHLGLNLGIDFPSGLKLVRSFDVSYFNGHENNLSDLKKNKDLEMRVLLPIKNPKTCLSPRVFGSYFSYTIRCFLFSKNCLQDLPTCD